MMRDDPVFNRESGAADPARLSLDPLGPVPVQVALAREEKSRPWESLYNKCQHEEAGWVLPRQQRQPGPFCFLRSSREYA